MTSAPVKDVSSLMNFVGEKNLTKTGGMNQTDSFGDVMSRTRSGASGTQSQNVAGRQAQKNSAASLNGSRKTVKVQNTAKEAVKTEDLTEQQMKAAEEAGNEVVKEVAKELGITQEDVEKAMEELGLSAYSLLDPANMTQLVLKLSGDLDTTALLTDGDLFANLQNLLNIAEEAKSGLMEKMDLDPEDMQALLETMKAGEGMENVSEEDALVQEAEKAPKITVEARVGGEEVKLTADEKGNITGNAEIIPSNAEESVTDKQADSQGRNSDEKKGQSESMLNTGNQMINALLQDKVQEVEGTFEQTATFFNEQTQDIMNQIMDHMRIQLKPGLDQLEMQLHPASLGTVHVQLTNRGGEITAQFHVQNEAVKTAIESQVATLQESFKEQGVKVEAVQVTVENHGFESNLWQGQKREENTSSQNSRKTPRRININDLGGGFEEEASEEDLLTAKMMEANGNTVDYTA